MAKHKIKPALDERRCIRCGCTEHKACAQGCDWVAGSNVCSACLTGIERELWHSLVFSLGEANNDSRLAERRLQRSQLQLHMFGRVIGGAR